MFYLLNMAHNKIGTWEREENRREKTVNTEIEMQYRVLSLIHQMTFFFPPEREKQTHTDGQKTERDTDGDRDRQRQTGRQGDRRGVTSQVESAALHTTNKTNQTRSPLKEARPRHIFPVWKVKLRYYGLPANF